MEASSQPGAITAGGPMASASTYVPASASAIASTSEAMSTRTRPRENPPRPSRTVPLLCSRGATRSGGRSASASDAVAVSSGGQLLMRPDEVVHVGVARRLRAVADAELAVQVREVELDRLLGHPELAGDPPVRGAGRDHAEDLQLAAREALGGAVVATHRGVVAAVEGVEHVAHGHLADQQAQALEVHVLRDGGVDAGRG